MSLLTKQTRRFGAALGRCASRLGRESVAAWLRFANRLALAVAIAAFAGPLAAQSGAIEYTIKAAYLFKFTPFIEWPTSAFPAPSSPFYVCVLGGDPFGASLDQAWNGRQVYGHPVKVRRLQALDGNGECHILYIGASRAPAAAAALSKVRGTPVLTVTEQSSGVSGGVVQFVVKDGHVRFTIDADAAATNRVVISAKLLSLAAAVKAGS